MIEIIPNILILFSLYTILFIVLYINYISKSESDIVKNNINYIVDNLITDNDKFILSEKDKEHIINSLEMLENTDFLKQLDEEETNKNKDLINKSIKYSITGFVITFLLAFAWCYFYKLDFWQILLNNSIIIIFLLGIELCFFYIVRHKFLIADPNVVKNEIINILFS